MSKERARDRLGRFLSSGKDRGHLNFNDTFAERLEKFLSAAPGGGISIYSGYRSPQRQRELYRAAVSKYGKKGARNWVAPPGRSRHNFGIAADLRYATQEAKDWAKKNAKAFGLNFRMKHEPWHVEPIDAKELMALGPVGRPKVDVPEVADPLSDSPFFSALKQSEQAPAAAWEAMPALAYEAPRQAISPYATQASLAPTASPAQGALAAIERVAPTGPSASIEGQLVDMSRFAPEAPTTPEQRMAMAETRPMLDAALGTPTMSMTGANFGGISPESMPGFGGTFPGVSMPATPSGPTGAETLYAKAQDPATFARPPGDLAAALTPPAAQTATPMAGLQPPGTGPLPSAPVPAEMPLAQLPALAPPREIKDYPVAEVASPEEESAAAWQSQPSLSVADVYGGEIGTAAASDGNFVSRDPYGITTVTNKYGVTTGMMPDGKQTAYGTGGPNFGALSSVFSGLGANRNKIAGQVLGALAGGALLGPAGALAGGYFGGQFGARNDYPSAPSRSNDRQGVEGGDRTRSERASRSPAASRSIDRGDRVSGLW